MNASFLRLPGRVRRGPSHEVEFLIGTPSRSGHLSDPPPGLYKPLGPGFLSTMNATTHTHHHHSYHPGGPVGAAGAVMRV